MSRPLRINMAGGWYHVTARGNEQRPIFWEDDDRLQFLNRSAEMVERFECSLYAYVLMENHFHFEMETHQANLSRAMQWLIGGYSAGFNARHHRSGHLFHARFHAVVLDPAEAALEVSRYVHLNPIRLRRFGLNKEEQHRRGRGVGPSPSEELIRRRLAELQSYRWSSYRTYIGCEPAAAWLSSQSLLARWGMQPRAYQDYVEKVATEGRFESPWDRLQGQVILGGQQFVEQMQAHLLGDARQQPALRALRPRVSWPHVVAVVEALKGEQWNHFRDRYGDWGRDVALWLAWKHTDMTLQELGRKVGGIDYVSVGSAIQRLLQRSSRDPQLASVLALAHQQLKIAET
jgi:putative transposase